MAHSLVDSVYWFPVQKHQLVNFDKRVNASVEEGVAVNQLICKKEMLQLGYNRLAATLDLLQPRAEVVENSKKRARESDIPVSPVKNPKLGFLRRSMGSMGDMIKSVDAVLELEQVGRATLQKSRDEENRLPALVRSFLAHHKENIDDEAVKTLVAFYQYTINSA